MRAMGQAWLWVAIGAIALGCKKHEQSMVSDATPARSSIAVSSVPGSSSTMPAPSSTTRTGRGSLSPSEQARYDELFPKCQANDASACETICNDLDPQVCTYVASQMLAGKVADDPAKCAKLNQRGCDGGALKSCNQLATAYKKGDGVPVEIDKAIALYNKSCDGGEGGGCSHLATLFGYGDLVPQDLTKAKAFSDKACKLGAKDCEPPIGEGANATWPIDAKLEDVIIDPKKWDGQLVQLRGVAAYRGSPTSGYIFSEGGNPMTDGVPTMMDEGASSDVKKDWLKMPSTRDGIPIKKVIVRVQATMVPGKARFFIFDALQFYGSAGK